MDSLENSYCMQVVKEQDPDRFLLTHFAPSMPRGSDGLSPRGALWALFAFNHEIAKTREVVSETQLGLIRLQWWRDAIAAIYEKGAVPEHEVVQALAVVINKYDLPREDFDALIYAREFDLEDVLPSNLEGAVHYADYTSTPLLRLAGRVAGADVDMEPLQVVATNYALVGILRATISFAQRRRCYLPQDLMEAHGVRVGMLYDPPSGARSGGISVLQDGLKAVIEATAGAFVDGVKCDHRFLRAHQRLAAVYIGQLRRLDYDVFDGRIMVPPAFKALRVYLDV